MRASWPALLLLLLAAGLASAGEEPAAPAAPSGAARAGATEADLALAAGARASVVRVRWRNERFGDLTATRNAVVVRRDGLLVMAGPPPGADGTLTVHLQDGQELRAELLAADAETALSLLQVPTTGLTPCTLASTPGGAQGAPLQPPPVGQRVVMVTGDGSVAVGVVRSHGRHGTLFDSITRRRVLTTGLFGAALAAVDVDEGAPLLDPQGHVCGLLVGRRAAVAPEAGASAARRGLKLRPEPVEAVAVPASVVELVWPLLEQYRRVPRAGLGVVTEPADAALRAHLGLSSGGHVIKRLLAGGSAEEAGLARFDVIVSLDGRPTPPGTTLHDVLLPFRPRSRVRLGYIRGGKRRELELVLGERSEPR